MAKLDVDVGCLLECGKQVVDRNQGGQVIIDTAMRDWLRKVKNCIFTS